MKRHVDVSCLFCHILASMNNDPWLEKWLALIRNKSTGGTLLELGCGNGRDTIDLLSAGCTVIAADLSMENLRECASSVSQASLLRIDNGKSLPFANGSIAVIIASLSLHYFLWDVTMQISRELKRCLKSGGILIARFNSTNDVNYGAGSGEEIEPNFYHVRTNTKRFFDENSVRLFLQGWDMQFFEENIIHRYNKPKAVWEVMAVPRKSAPVSPKIKCHLFSKIEMSPFGRVAFRCLESGVAKPCRQG